MKKVLYKVLYNITIHEELSQEVGTLHLNCNTPNGSDGTNKKSLFKMKVGSSPYIQQSYRGEIRKIAKN